MNAPTAVVDQLYGRRAFRVKGIPHWNKIANLGRANVGRLRTLLQETATSALGSDEVDKKELREMRRGVGFLSGLEKNDLPPKPLLPHLRNELFRVGDPVVAYVGDLVGSRLSWVHGTVRTVSKAFNPQWKTAVPSSGYFWRVSTLLGEQPMEGLTEIACSTTEPRLLLRGDYDYLVQARHSDPECWREPEQGLPH
ncbi:MAG: hypothetical protein AAF657_00710 [Acidobacteriota bacterium]